MADSGLFGYLAQRFGTAPETVAAEALTYILARSGTARAGLVNVCAIAAPGLPLGLEIRRQSDSTAEPDQGLVGVDENGVVRLTLRPLGWSVLPDRQPMQDLELLAADQAGSVVMVAPIERFTTLWADLRRRCRLAGLPVHGDHAAGSPVRWTRIGAAHTLLLVSWGALLAGVRASVMAGRDAPLTQEIDQLANFCERLDADAFPPLATAELAALTPRRLGQLLDILDDVAMACEQRGIGQHVGVDARASRGAFCRSLRVGHFEFALIWSVPLWATQRETPFWLQITPATAAPATPIEEQLLTLSYELPPRLLRDPSHGQPLVPLFPLTGVGRAAVVADLVVQVEAVARLLDEAPTIGFGSATVRST